MAHLLRGKQAGIQNDLSAGIAPDVFAIDDVRLHLPELVIKGLQADTTHSLLVSGSTHKYVRSHTTPYSLYSPSAPRTVALDQARFTSSDKGVLKSHSRFQAELLPVLFTSLRTRSSVWTRNMTSLSSLSTQSAPFLLTRLLVSQQPWRRIPCSTMP